MQNGFCVDCYTGFTLVNNQCVINGFPPSGTVWVYCKKTILLFDCFILYYIFLILILKRVFDYF